MKTKLAAAGLLLLLASSADGAEPQQMQFAKHTFDIQRSLAVGATANATVGTVFYSETSRGSEAYFLDAPFSHHPMLAANIDITTEEPLRPAMIVGSSAYCTTRAIGRDHRSLVCFSDADGDGSVEQWRKVSQMSGLPYLSEAKTIDPIRVHKAVAEPKAGEEAILEVRYMGLSDGKAKFHTSLRVANQDAILKQSDTLVSLNAAGATLAMIENPFAPPSLTALAAILSARPATAGASPFANQMTAPILVLDVAKADDHTATITVRQQFPNWRYWRVKDANGKDGERSMLCGPATESSSQVSGAVDLVNRDNVARSVYVCGDGCDVFRTHGQRLTLAPGEIKKDVCMRDCFFLVSESEVMNLNAAIDELKNGRTYSGDVTVSVVNGKVEGPSSAPAKLAPAH
jgi:hypothetical protein